MTFSEKYKLKLERNKQWEIEKQERKRQRKLASKKRLYAERSAEYKARHLAVRAELLRLQGHKCAICKRSGLRLIADSYQNKVVRGMLCNRCNHFIARHNDNPETILSKADKPRNKMPHRLLVSAARYLNNWPSSRLQYLILSRNVLTRQDKSECDLYLLDSIAS